jgi:hypothetical protein
MPFTQVTSFHRMNKGRGREVPEPECCRGEKVRVHRSVKIRMKAKGMDYKPKALFHHLDFEWVD